LDNLVVDENMQTVGDDSRTTNTTSTTGNLLCEISDICKSSLVLQPGIDASFLGNGYCNNYAPYNTEECCWDGGDCIKVFTGNDCIVTPETCSGADINLLGNGICEIGNYIYFQNTTYNEGCCWDGGDCLKFFDDSCTANIATCAGNMSYLGDGYCDDYWPYNTKGCCWDGNDCSGPKPTGLDMGGVVVIVVFIGALSSVICCVYVRAKRNRNNNTSTPAQPAAAANAGITAAERRSQRRELILMSIIHKKIKSKSIEPAEEQDIVVDLEGAAQTEENLDLPHEEILSLRSSKIIPDVLGTTTAEQLNGNGGISVLAGRYEDDNDNDDDDDAGGTIFAIVDLRTSAGTNSSITSGVFGNKDDIMIETLRSIRSSLHISIIDDSSLYSPKSCPICCDDYAKGDDIAWSKNEQCCHAFHTDCIIDWLMNHDDCPMCRNNYLEETE